METRTADRPARSTTRARRRRGGRRSPRSPAEMSHRRHHVSCVASGQDPRAQKCAAEINGRPRHGTHSCRHRYVDSDRAPAVGPAPSVGKHPTRAFLLVSALPRFSRFERAQEDFLRSDSSARGRRRAVHSRPIGTRRSRALRNRGGVLCASPSSRSRRAASTRSDTRPRVFPPARSPTASAESDSRTPRIGGGTRGPQGVAAMARVRMRVCADAASRRAPAAPRRRETASRGAHRCESTARVHARRSLQPRTRRRPLPALHSTARTGSSR